MFRQVDNSRVQMLALPIEVAAERGGSHPVLRNGVTLGLASGSNQPRSDGWLGQRPSCAGSSWGDAPGTAADSKEIAALGVGRSHRFASRYFDAMLVFNCPVPISW